MKNLNKNFSENISSFIVNVWHPYLKWFLFAIALCLSLYFSKKCNAVPSWIVYEEILQQDISHPEIVFAQYILETGHGKSRAFLQLNNTHGFSNSKLIKFNSWRESIRFYKRWQSKYDCVSNYYEFLCKYWGAPNMDEYIHKIQTIVNGKKRFLHFRRC